MIQLWLVESLIPDSISKLVLGYLTQFTTKASRLGSASFAALLFSTVALMFTIDRTLNAIWQVRKPRPWHQRLLLYWAAITLGPLIIAASVVMMTSVIAFSGMGNSSEGSLIRWVLDSLEFFIFLFAIASLYKYVPNTHVPWTHALVGGLTTNALLELAR
ncbi:MAG: YihY family inner membrane protein [Limnohabitans sp.]|nr:YihY family inner membrane protein [Limnohabitans sp.]